MKQTLGIALACILVTSVAVAQPAARRARVRRAPTPPPAPALTFAVDAEAGRPFHVRARLDVARAGLTDAVADMRWITFEIPVEGRRRPLTCSYPGAPANTDTSKVVASPPAGSALFDAIVDVRMWCTGAAFDAIERGAAIHARYGVRSVTTRRFLVHDTERRARRLASVEAPPFVLTNVPPVADTDAPVRVGMSSFQASRSVVANPYLEGIRASRVYLRSDLWSFDITTPARRTVRCVVPRHPVVPIVDFFTRLSPGSRRSTTIDVSTLCPRIFDEPGVYDVVPVLELVYDGANVDVDGLVGTFRGRPSFIRIRPPAEAEPTEFVRPAP